MRIDLTACRDPDLLAAEVRRLQSVIAAREPEIAELEQAIRRLADEDATLSVQGGNVTVTMDATFTDEERKAIWTVAETYGENDDDPECQRIARIMHGLWQRTK